MSVFGKEPPFVSAARDGGRRKKRKLRMVDFVPLIVLWISLAVYLFLGGK